MTDPRLDRARDEQIRLAALLQSGHPDREGITLTISDWFWEEVLIERELDVAAGRPRGQPGNASARRGRGAKPRRNVGQLWRNVSQPRRLLGRKEAARSARRQES